MGDLARHGLRVAYTLAFVFGGLPAQGVPAANIAKIESAVAQPESSILKARPCDDCVEGVTNFAKISEALWRGAQPTAAGFQNLEKLGARTIVSFKQGDDDLPLLKGTRLKYLHIPSRAFRPTQAHIVTFLKVMEDPVNWPVFIHCAQGRDRTGYNAAAYRMVVQGWSAEDAILEMNAFHFNRIWVGNPGFLKRLDVQAIREKVKAQAEPVYLTDHD